MTQARLGSPDDAKAVKPAFDLDVPEAPHRSDRFGRPQRLPQTSFQPLLSELVFSDPVQRTAEMHRLMRRHLHEVLDPRV